jgi:amidophosphoribosyltransferase
VYGIDFPERSKLMAATNSLDEIRRFLNADSLGYLSLEGMVAATGRPKNQFCLACYDGDYPVAYDPSTDKHIIERRRSRAGTLSAELESSLRQPRLL